MMSFLYTFNHNTFDFISMLYHGSSENETSYLIFSENTSHINTDWFLLFWNLSGFSTHEWSIINNLLCGKGIAIAARFRILKEMWFPKVDVKLTQYCQAQDHLSCQTLEMTLR